MQDEKQQPKDVKFKQNDLKVISILWAYELVEHWLLGLSFYTFLVVFPDEEFSPVLFKQVELWIFVVALVSTLVVALMVDSNDHRYLVSIIGLCLSCTTPVWALVTCTSKLRSTVTIIFSTIAASFVVCPANYSLIFNQNLNPSRREVRFIVSFLECIVSLLGKYLAFVCIPSHPSSGRYVVLLICLVWVIIIPVLLYFIMSVLKMKKDVTGDFIHEKGIKRIFLGLRNDMKIQPPRRKGKSAIEIVFFILLLLPVLSITSLDAALTNANSDEEAKAQSPTLKHIKYSNQVIVIPLTELAIAIIPFKDTTSEILVLGVAHFVNIFVIALFIIRLDSIIPESTESDGQRSNEGGRRSFLCLDPDDCSLPEPGPGFVTYFVMTSVNCTLNAEPPALFNSVPVRLAGCSYIFGEFHLPDGETEMTFKFTYTLDLPGSDNPPSNYQIITIKEKKHYLYIISSDDSSHIDCHEVLNIERTKPRRYPQLILLSSICNHQIDNIEFVPSDSVFGLLTDRGAQQVIPLSDCGVHTDLGLPAGVGIHLSYSYRGTDEHLAKILTKHSLTFKADPSVKGAVYLAFVLRNETNVFLYLVLIRTENPVTTTPSTSTTVTETSSDTSNKTTVTVTESSSTSSTNKTTVTVTESSSTSSTNKTTVTVTESSSTTSNETTATVTNTSTITSNNTVTMTESTQNVTDMSTNATTVTLLTTTSTETTSEEPQPEPLTTTKSAPTLSTTTAPPEPKPPDVKQQTTYAMYGAALGITSVGYTHFFWVESPLRLRAFLYALFRVAIEVVRRITERIVGHTFTRSQAMGLLMLQVFTMVWHIGLSWIFQTKIRFRRD